MDFVELLNKCNINIIYGHLKIFKMQGKRKKTRKSYIKIQKE